MHSLPSSLLSCSVLIGMVALLHTHTIAEAFAYGVARCLSYPYLYCALSLAAQCIVISPVCVCVFVGLCVCLWVCYRYHDNSKLRASIFTNLGM